MINVEEYVNSYMDGLMSIFSEYFNIDVARKVALELVFLKLIKNNAKNEGGIKMSYIEVIHEFKRYKMEEKRLITLKKLAVFFLKIN